METMTVRRMDFGFPDEIDPVFKQGQPEWSYVATGLSIIFAHAEPYLIATLKEASRALADPLLRADVQQFCGQEGQHYRQHRQFNDLIRKQGYADLMNLERELAADYRRFTETRSLTFNLAYAEGVEALTTALALFVAEQNMLGDDVSGPARDLLRWHLLEELEHRTVAFDAYRHLGRGYGYRIVASIFAQYHLVRFVLRVAACMERADVNHASFRFGGRHARNVRVRALVRTVLMHLAPKVLRTYSPWYHPMKLKMPEEVRSWATSYTAAAISTSG